MGFWQFCVCVLSLVLWMLLNRYFLNRYLDQNRLHRGLDWLHTHILFLFWSVMQCMSLAHVRNSQLLGRLINGFCRSEPISPCWSSVLSLGEISSESLPEILSESWWMGEAKLLYCPIAKRTKKQK